MAGELAKIAERYARISHLNQFITNYLQARELYLQGNPVTKATLADIIPAIKASLELRLAR